MKRAFNAVVRLAMPAIVAGALTACAPQSDVDLNRRVQQLTEQVAERDRRIEALQAASEEQQRQINTIRGFTRDDLERIVAPERLEIAALSGGRDLDSLPGDDGVRIYLKPIDREGDALKVAGDIRVDLFDLSEPSGQTLIGSCTWPADQVRTLWHGRFLTYHYTLDCRWNRPPRGAEVTVRVTFRDYITQRLLTTQAVFNVTPLRPAP
ncbi:MAG TPA: hypothetical protein PKC49_15680 [Phycisphaerae bacterium]|nr:hypothetical protein [Phycisphaerae bacterium]